MFSISSKMFKVSSLMFEISSKISGDKGCVQNYDMRYEHSHWRETTLVMYLNLLNDKLLQNIIIPSHETEYSEVDKYLDQIKHICIKDSPIYPAYSFSNQVPCVF